MTSPISASEAEQAAYDQGFRAAIGVALRNAGCSREDLDPLRGDVLVGGSYIIRQDAIVQAWEMLRAKVRAELSPRPSYAVGTRLRCLDGYEGIVVTDPGGESRIVVAVEGRESGEEFWNPRFIVTAAGLFVPLDVRFGDQLHRSRSMTRLVRTSLNAFWESFLGADITTAAKVDALGITGKNMVWSRDREALVAIARKSIADLGWDHAKVAVRGLPGLPGPVLCLYAAEDRGEELRRLWRGHMKLVGTWEWKLDATTDEEFAVGTHPTQTTPEARTFVQETRNAVLARELVKMGGPLAAEAMRAPTKPAVDRPEDDGYNEDHDDLDFGRRY